MTEKSFNLNAVMTSVLESGVLFKDSGLWQYYRDENDFTNEKEYMQQHSNEDFETFMKRVVSKLMELEEHEDERIIAINYAIYSNSQLNHRLSELLAVLHRDGGHYETDNGTEKAIEDAIKKLHSVWILADKI